MGKIISSTNFEYRHYLYTIDFMDNGRFYFSFTNDVACTGFDSHFEACSYAIKIIDEMYQSDQDMMDMGIW